MPLADYAPRQSQLLRKIAELNAAQEPPTPERLAADLGLTLPGTVQLLRTLQKRNWIDPVARNSRHLPVVLTGWGRMQAQEETLRKLPDEQRPVRVSLGTPEQNDGKVLLHLPGGEVQAEDVLGISWFIIGLWVGDRSRVTFSQDDFRATRRRLTTLRMGTAPRHPHNGQHTCEDSLVLHGAPSYLTRLEGTLGPGLSSLPGVCWLPEEGRIEVPPFAYQARRLLDAVSGDHTADGLTLPRRTDEPRHLYVDPLPLPADWVTLTAQYAACERRDRQRHLCLTYGPALAWPGHHLLVRGPHDPAWAELARQLSDHRWSEEDQADLFPVKDLREVTQALNTRPHYRLLSPEEEREVRDLNMIYPSASS